MMYPVLSVSDRHDAQAADLLALIEKRQAGAIHSLEFRGRRGDQSSGPLKNNRFCQEVANMSAEQTHGRDNALVVAGGATALVLAALCLALAGSGQQGTVTGLRATAVLALPFLVGAFAAPALAVLWPGKFSERLLARRRSLGLTFSAVFSVHLVLIARFLSLPPNPAPTALGLTLGFVAYMLLAGMVLTSFSGVTKALGASRVRLLRRVGEQWVFAVFTLTLINGASKHSALWLVPLAIVMAAYVMRLEAWARTARYRRQRRHSV